jgi:hypothetical protein
MLLQLIVIVFLFMLFLDSRIGSDKEKILKDNNNIDIMASESIEDITEKSVGVFRVCLHADGFKTASIEFSLTYLFSTVFSYTSLIEIVGNDNKLSLPITSALFIAQHSANVNTSMSSSIAPTITISKASNFQTSVQSPHIQSVSPVCLNQSSSSQLCQASSLPGSVSNSLFK